MKATLFFVMISFVSGVFAQEDYRSQLEKEREKAQLEMLFEVLDSTERKTFTGICYFPIDTTLIVQAEFHRKKGRKFLMPMTKARDVWYRQYGTIQFLIRDTLCSLVVYQNLSLKKKKEYRDYLFLPFRDGTTAISTYGAGRYIDLHKGKSNTITIDFNKAYHPYCAYSARYSCPIVPQENTVIPAITAGECYVHHED